MSSFGNFTENGREYIINDFNTPRPLLNYMWNDKLLSGVNHFGGGMGSYGGRTTAYIDPEGRGRCSLYNNGTRYFYIRDEENGDFFNPGWYPVKREMDSYKCTQGVGYSLINGSYKGIEANLRAFVNQDDPVEIWTITITNHSDIKRFIKTYAVVEYSLTGYQVYCNYYATLYAKFYKNNNMIIASNKAQERPHDWYDGFIASSIDVSGFDTSKTAFFGPYGSVSDPRAIAEGKCKNSIAVGEDMVGVLENSIALDPGEVISFHILMGATNSYENAASVTKKLLKNGKIESDFNKLSNSKDKMVGNICIKTPDEKINNLTNIWLKQQIQLCAEVGRDTGKGFRDQLQDAWAIAAFNPDLARDKILETLQYQYKNGSCVRGWLPLDEHLYSDGPTWIAPTINAYLKETGDSDFLNIKVPFLDEGEASVWEHILKSVRYSSEDTGSRNLVLARAGDWNDSLNGIGVGGKGESVWTSIALYNALGDVLEMAIEIYNDKDLEEEMIMRSERIKTAINDTGWDKDWYLAGYTDRGDRVGSHTEKEGSIYLNSQTWAVITGVAEGERLEQCLKSIDEKLDSPYGPLTLYPTYTAYNPEIGRLTSFVPGIWENGTPYCHGGTFKIVADCCVGRGNKAYESVLKIIPDSIENPSTESGCEPYALTNMYFGPDNPKAGQTMFAWVTGTAGWMFRAITQYMIGFYPGYKTVTIEPCIPEIWEELSFKRIYRGACYNITIVNKNKSQYGVKKVRVDGLVMNGNEIPIFCDEKEHKIIVEM